jgi:hypothetical protein
MLARPLAQALVDGLSALSLGAAAFAVARNGPRAPLRLRLVYAFGGLCLFFAARSAAAVWADPALGLLTLLVGSALPPGALILAEGALRRHAPRAVKAAVIIGAVATDIALVAAKGEPPASSWVLGGYIVATLLTVMIMLVSRDRSSLSRQENAGVDALVVAGALLTLLSLTDFLPAAPVGLSGVGAAAAAFVLSANPTSTRDAGQVLTDLGATAALGILGALALAVALGALDLREQARLSAVVVSLLFAAGAILSARRLQADSPARGFRQALAAADLADLEAYLNSLAHQPLLAGLRLTQGAALAEYDCTALGPALAARPVWTRPVVEDPGSPLPRRAREELEDLMARHESTHAMLLSQSPLRIALLTLPSLGPAGPDAVDLALFHKLAAVAARELP